MHKLRYSIPLLATLLVVTTTPAHGDDKLPSTGNFDHGDTPWLADDAERPASLDESDIQDIADNLLLFQNDDGGWPKNIDMCLPLSENDRKQLEQLRGDLPSTFDNGATHSQLKYLAAAYNRTGDQALREAFLRGMSHVLDAQYSNGGWPQSAEGRGYSGHITFNDNTMYGIMEVLQEIVHGESQYHLVPEEVRTRAAEAYQRGLDCIVACQITTGGRKTAWGQQHHYQTLESVGARAFEKPCTANGESAKIVRLLMDEPNPSSEVVEAIESAVEWFRDSEIHGIRVERVKVPHRDFRYHSVDFDRVVVEDPDAPPLWARCYELGTLRPIFCGRDGVVRYSLAEIDLDRRTGYSWYVDSPSEVLRKYDAWQQRRDN